MHDFDVKSRLHEFQCVLLAAYKNAMGLRRPGTLSYKSFGVGKI